MNYFWNTIKSPVAEKPKAEKPTESREPPIETEKKAEEPAKEAVKSAEKNTTAPESGILIYTDK